MIRSMLASSCLLVSSMGFAAQVQIAVAANFGAPAKQIAADFEKETGHQAVIITGATGAFYAQIKNGAPFEILLAADDETPARLEKEGLAFKESRFTYAIGKLVLWSSKPGLVDGSGEVLRRGNFTHLSIINPRTSPYGAAAMEVLHKRGLSDALASRFVQGESVTQAYQFVATGNAELGFVALSQVWKEGKLAAPGSVWIVPEDLYSELRQDAVLLARGKGGEAAAAFLKYLRSEKARAVIHAFGYGSK